MTNAASFQDNCREYGKKRLDIISQVKSADDWMRLWYDPIHPYTFEWGDCWKGCIEYRVDDYEAELGFWLDVMGLDSNALGTDFAMIMTPDKQFFFSFKPADEKSATAADAVHIQFMLSGILKSAAELEKRGVVFETPVQPESPGSPLYTGTLRTPHGIAVDLWGMEPASAE